MAPRGIGCPVAVWLKFVRGQNLVVERIADGKVVLRTPSLDAALAIKSHLEGGRLAKLSATRSQAQILPST